MEVLDHFIMTGKSLAADACFVPPGAVEGQAFRQEQYRYSYI